MFAEIPLPPCGCGASSSVFSNPVHSSETMLAQYGLKDLQVAALNGIISHLSPENLVQECFSVFFSMYVSLCLW